MEYDMRIFYADERKGWLKTLALRSGQELTWNSRAIQSGHFDRGNVTFLRVKRVAEEYGAEYVGNYAVVYEQDEMGNLTSGVGHILVYKTKKGEIKSCASSWFEGF